VVNFDGRQMWLLTRLNSGGQIMRARWNGWSRGTWAAGRLTGLLLGLAALAMPAAGQSFAGRWAATGRTLDNGEQEKAVLVLQQNGNQLTGHLQTWGFDGDITGKVDGSHFDLFGPRSNTRPMISGDLVNGELHGLMFGRRAWVAKPATPADDIPAIPYIEPPALHKVSSNGLAKTPPMGWNSWNLFAGKVDDATVRTMADAMVSSGMRDAGYVYVNIDDTWQGVRDSNGNLQANHKFPDMKALADYVHSKGLKLGIYSGPGPRTCASYPGSYGHEEQDAKTFAAWGIDYLKYDWCSAATIYKDDKLQPVYQKMGDALEATGRPIVYSLCEYGRGSVEKWGADVGGNLWRTTDDIRDAWASMIGNVEEQVPTAPYAGPGHWNDPDMLEIGNGHMTDDEYRTHMSLWALTAAPLLAGNDIRSMTEATRAILMNKEVIAVDQDALGKQASPEKNGELETWVKPLADGSVAVGVVNMGAAAASASVSASELHLNGGAVKARDLWAHKDVQFAGGSYSTTVPSHGVLLLRVPAK
jgi:alpha-galactosidase